MKKLIVLIVLLAFAGFAVAELYDTPIANAGFEAGLSGWGTWGSGSGSGPAGYKWASHWGYVDTTGGANGSQNFYAATTLNQPAGYYEYWGWAENCFWRADPLEKLDWTSTPGTGQVKISGWFKALSGAPTGAGSMYLEWVDFSGGDPGGGSPSTLPKDIFMFDITTDWAYYAIAVAVPDGARQTGGDGLGAYGVRPVWSTNVPGILTGIDDVHATWIPEPMSIALLGLGGLFLRRRK